MKITHIRRIVQTAFLCLLVSIPLLVGKGITFITGTLYSMSIGPLDLTDPLSGFQVIILTLGATAALLVSLIIPVAFTLVFGRAFCGWLCPQNLFSELADIAASGFMPRRLLPQAKQPLSRFIVLGLVLIGCLAAGYPLANLISAPGIISVQINNIIAAGTIGAEAALIALILLGEIFIMRRFWCNQICAVGTFLGLFRLPWTMSVAMREGGPNVCNQCGECAQACQLGLDPQAGGIYPQCHNCGDCIEACREQRGSRSPLFFSIGGFRRKDGQYVSLKNREILCRRIMVIAVFCISSYHLMRTKL